MDRTIEKKLEIWKNNLLDMSKKNALLSFKETKRASLYITAPDYGDLYDRLVNKEETLTFPQVKKEALKVDDAAAESAEEKIEADTETDEAELEQVRFDEKLLSGDIETNKDTHTLQGILGNLRSNAKTAIEEQGINILYLAFGFLEWGETAFSKDKLRAPLVLVPVTLTTENINQPYQLSLHEDEILLNPTLVFKLSNDLGMTLPEFDDSCDDLEEYLESIQKCVASSGWSVDKKVALSSFSFQKINMYQDLKNRAEIIGENEIVRALAGQKVMSIPDDIDIMGYDHDRQDPPDQVFQILDADSSQQDAVVLSKKGCSFVLQGPPGTGKSQTITNIIAEAMAEGKKVLFVSEKMAALDVVYKRLASAGLDDFCLVLHSKKANKKEILDSLRKVLNLTQSPIAVNDSAIYKLYELEESRKQLNAYCSELHQVIEPLHQTVYDANGILAQLEKVPNLSFTMPKEKINAISKKDLHELIRLIKNFSGALSMLSEDYGENTWRNCILESLNHELSHDIQAKIDQLTELFPTYLEEVQELFDDLLLDSDPTYHELEDLIQLLRFCATAKPFPKEWLGDQSISDLTARARELQMRKNEQTEIMDKIGGSFTDDFYKLSGEQYGIAILAAAKAIQAELSRGYLECDEVIQNMEDLQRFIPRASERMELEQELCLEIAEELGVSVPGKQEEIPGFFEFLLRYQIDFKASELWFHPIDWTPEHRESCIEKAEQLVESIRSCRDEILETYEPEILEIDCKEMLTRFKTDYTSCLRMFNGGFKADCNVIRAHCKVPTKKIAYETAVGVLEQLKKYHQLEAELQEFEGMFRDVLGGWYIGEETNFKKIRTAFNGFDQVTVFCKGRIPDAAKAQILEQKNVDEFIHQLEQLLSCSADEDIQTYLSLCGTPELQIKGQLESLHRINDQMNVLEKLLHAISDTAKNDISPVLYREYLELLCRYQTLQKEDEAEYEKLKEEYSFLFEEFNTDWDLILRRLAWTEQFKSYAEKYDLPVAYQSGIASEERYAVLSGSLADYLQAFRTRIDSLVQWFSGLFTTEEGILNLTAEEFYYKLRRCRDNLKGLGTWIDFRRAQDLCEKAGLNQFTSLALESGLEPKQFCDVFLKRFENLWLDQVLPGLSAVEHFREQNQEALIKEFRALDTEQLKIAQLRIREALIRALPRTDSVTSGKDEVAILKRELGKQRRLMPIRKLLSQIPTLLPKLKPCMMMSPLSVSMFLQDENYIFDMVIFDEASQVRTENAIGAISRGKQVIIAGDIHQLPPTSFFSATLSGSDDFDEEDDSGSFESVLDEATMLPSIELKWHYRSRNEGLIAFSNTKIYHDSLVTFPSPTEDTGSEGVEYIYVPDGLYDRSRKRDNPIEARKVAELVFQQIRDYPERSLGVITFSTAQQNRIENEINQRRLIHPELNDFFNEEKEEAFFIKNLESVQGDERDTIIFSIGYGKASPLEPLHMSFGPLNNQGGHRRLNVAITRAKYAVKLVGSILPTDMRLTDDTPLGVKLLHDYIDYAQNGPSVLTHELEIVDTVNTESPFEDAVYDFLTGHGYQVATQVGCSGYRIDMAVRHPSLHGKFVIGVECDGATYHSSRTARERDRLRQAVLESMGWKFVRIWSTDWIKDPITEGQRLLHEVEAAIHSYGQMEQKPFSVNSEEQEDDYITELDPEEVQDNQPVFPFYEEIIVEKRVSEAPPPRVAEQINTIVQEQAPIHIALVCKQLAPMYCNTKVTAKVRNGVDKAIQFYEDRYGWERRGDYLWLKDQADIVPKIAKEGEKPRPIDMIAPEELAELMRAIIFASYGLDKTALFQLVVQKYGFLRTTAKMADQLELAFKVLCEKYDIKNTAGKLTLDM